MALTIDHPMLNKVPLITLFFWIIKILATTVGETGADFLNFNLGLGLELTSLVAAVLLAVALVIQFRQHRYVPWVYWIAVVFLSVVGTLITDNLSDNLGISLYTTTTIFALALALTFFAWFRSEKTLSIHAVTTTRREAFYWAAILFTFALGTAAGDLASEKLGLGYALSGLIFGGLIALVTIGYYAFRLNSVFAFWAAYVLTRPLGASMGDFLTQAHKDGGLACSTRGVSAALLAIIIALVTYLTVSRADRADAHGVAA
ncbi:MAG: membrane protein [Acidobacteriaceae bacterium]